MRKQSHDDELFRRLHFVKVANFFREFSEAHFRVNFMHQALKIKPSVRGSVSKASVKLATCLLTVHPEKLVILLVLSTNPCSILVLTDPIIPLYKLS